MARPRAPWVNNGSRFAIYLRQLFHNDRTLIRDFRKLLKDQYPPRSKFMNPASHIMQSMA